MRGDDQSRKPNPHEGKKRPYEPPRITAYDVPGLLDMVGPAVACIRWDIVGSPPPDAEDRYEDDADNWWTSA